MWIICSLLILISGIILYNSRHTLIVRKAAYEATLLYNELVQEQWWHEIKPYRIVLGGIPLEDLGHGKKLSEEGIQSVLSMLEPFEKEPGLRRKPMKKEDWCLLDILNEEIPARDFLPLLKEEIHQGVAFLSTEMEKGNKVYVHCKAGRGRSASVVIAYLMKTYGFSFEESFNKVYSERPYIKINYYQKEAILDYIQSLKK